MGGFDFALILLPGWVMWDLNMHTGRKAVVITAFLFRTMYIHTQDLREETWTDLFVE